MLIIGAREFRAKKIYPWLTVGMYSLAVALVFSAIEQVLSLLTETNAVQVGASFQNGMTLAFMVGRAIAYFILMACLATGGRNLRKEKKYGWLAIAMFLVATYLFITVITIILSIYFSYAGSSMM